jgi:hypothetical protein
MIKTQPNRGFWLLLAFSLGAGSLFSQEQQPEWRQRLKTVKFQPVLAVQLWSSYTVDQKIYNAQTGDYEPVDDRFNLQIRRTRLGFKARPGENFSFQAIAALDLVGRDALTAQHGGANNGSTPEFGLWDAAFQWRIKPGSEAFYLSGGYFRPPFSRESLTSGMQVSSMEKSWSQRYVRAQLTGTNPGRAMGLQLGGLLHKAQQPLAFSYDLGIFNPVFEAYSGNSSGSRFSPLLVSRVSVHLGDPEFARYSQSHKLNYFGKRKGLTLSVQGAAQGETSLFRANYALGADVLFNYGPLNLDAEWSLLRRTGRRQEVQAPEFSVSGQTGHLRLSYNIRAGGQYVLEPVLMLMQFDGPTHAADQAEAKTVGMASGRESALDVGLNWYFGPDLKLMLHYTHHNGDAGAAGAGATVNDFFYQKETGAIERGDWLGLGLVAIF